LVGRTIPTASASLSSAALSSAAAGSVVSVVVVVLQAESTIAKITRIANIDEYFLNIFYLLKFGISFFFELHSRKRFLPATSLFFNFSFFFIFSFRKDGIIIMKSMHKKI
jgi:hypothetical protein